MEHKELTEELREQIAAHTLGALDEASVGEFSAHLAGCPVCREEFDQLESAAAALPYSLPAATPSAVPRARLLERLRASAAAAAEPMRAPLKLDFASFDWQPSGEPGTVLLPLRHDESSGTLVALVKIDPGCRYPSHLHAGGEDCFVLQGGFRDARGEYRAGDFVYYEPGSEHHGLQALEGEECVCLVIAHGGLKPL